MLTPNIVILDGYATNPGDTSWEPIAQLGKLKVHDRTSAKKVYSYAQHATVVVANKTNLDWYLLSRLRKTKLICVLATGYNNIDLDGADHFGITVCNAVGYGTASVAQHVFALLLEMTNAVAHHNADVQRGGWSNSPDWCYWKSPLSELAGKTMGIYGFGKIGQQVAQIAQAFGMKVLAFRKNQSHVAPSGVVYVPLETLFSQSDVLSLHAPLSPENEGIINAKTIGWMKPTAFLINTGRGGLIMEKDLREALLAGRIAGASLDVLTTEPPPADHPLIGLKNCLVTPHHAWASKESRERLIQVTADNIRAFLSGRPQNVVSGLGRRVKFS